MLIISYSKYNIKIYNIYNIKTYITFLNNIYYNII